MQALLPYRLASNAWIPTSGFPLSRARPSNSRKNPEIKPSYQQPQRTHLRVSKVHYAGLAGCLFIQVADLPSYLALPRSHTLGSRSNCQMAYLRNCLGRSIAVVLTRHTNCALVGFNL